MSEEARSMLLDLAVKLAKELEEKVDEIHYLLENRVCV